MGKLRSVKNPMSWGCHLVFFLKESDHKSLLYPFTAHHTFCRRSQFSTPRLLQASGDSKQDFSVL